MQYLDNDIETNKEWILNNFPINFFPNHKDFDLILNLLLKMVGNEENYN